MTTWHGSFSFSPNTHLGAAFCCPPMLSIGFAIQCQNQIDQSPSADGQIRKSINNCSFQVPCFLKAAHLFHLVRIKSQSQVSQANGSQSINHHYMLAAGCNYMTTIHKQDAWCPFMWILCSLHMFVPHELFPWKYRERTKVMRG